MRIQFKGQRLSFSLGTSNKEASARKSAAIYTDLLALGVEGAIAKHRLQQPQRGSTASIGEYLQTAKTVMAVRPATFAAYERHLRRIAADIHKTRALRRAKIPEKRASRKIVEALSLDILTPEAIQAWRLEFVAHAGTDGTKARSARISSNSIIRQARSLFAPKVVKFLGMLRLPAPLPFAGVDFYPRESMRYTSRIDAGVLIRKARHDLEESDSPAFLVILLALAAGLRRGEIDRLTWSHVEVERSRIVIEESAHGSLKNDDSRGAVDIDSETATILRSHQKKAAGQFVIEPKRATAGENSRSWGNRYRCVTVFERVNFWLRQNGVMGNKALHTLRKEAGAIVATHEGIFAASQFLRHSDIAVTAAHYADKKTRTVIDMAALFLENGTLDQKRPEPAARKKK